MTRTTYSVVSCDVDTIDRHLEGYGIANLRPCERIYRTALPRVLDLLDELGIRATFFLIGRDAAREQSLLREIIAAGHEVGSHSLTHPQPFRTLSDHLLREEIATSRRVLSEACGQEVVGFRAPAWDVDQRVLRFVAEAGYEYDASIFPSFVLLASRLATYLRSERKASIFKMDLLQHARARRNPHPLRIGERRIFEFPISVTPRLRLPVYHTISHFVPARVFERWLGALLRSGSPVHYEFHAADLLDMATDEVDERMHRHPGVNRPLGERREHLATILETIAAARRPVKYQEALQHLAHDVDEGEATRAGG